MLPDIIGKLWGRFWMLFAGISPLGKPAMRLATWFAPPHYGRQRLSSWNHRGYISPQADIHHADLRIGTNIFIDDRVVVYQEKGGGPVELGDRVHLYRDIIIQTGQEGSVKIGAHTFIQPRCIFSAYKGPIHIGSGVQIAPNSSFYSYNHSFETGTPIRNQPLATKGGITVEDNVWIGVGAIILDGVRIGRGAVIGAGSVVTQNIPSNAIAVGTPARVIRMRDDSGEKIYGQEMEK